MMKFLEDGLAVANERIQEQFNKFSGALEQMEEGLAFGVR
jgi:hypothetical protein